MTAETPPDQSPLRSRIIFQSFGFINFCLSFFGAQFVCLCGNTHCLAPQLDTRIQPSQQDIGDKIHENNHGGKKPQSAEQSYAQAGLPDYNDEQSNADDATARAQPDCHLLFHKRIPLRLAPSTAPWTVPDLSGHNILAYAPAPGLSHHKAPHSAPYHKPGAEPLLLDL
jgi:hypothetical protein